MHASPWELGSGNPEPAKWTEKRRSNHGTLKERKKLCQLDSEFWKEAPPTVNVHGRALCEV
ncbi:hypothetical protein CVT25_013792 [Psilocybe cyanescens]|uniref:Uncharacterized protein n=1 Tax=Psilocybe cyanescens TaxID=93625 RepID=A0A409WTU2_PSICY|nr:hypothetical protein CVT25_013792 [Psilocybe cyanescens]